MGLQSDFGRTDSKTQASRTNNQRTRISVLVLLLVYRFGLLHGFDRKGSYGSRWKGSRYNYSSILDEVAKGYSDHSLTNKMSNDTTPGGLFRDLWARGRKRSVSMMEGVRKSFQSRGGDNGFSSSWSSSRDPIPSLLQSSSSTPSTQSPSAINVDGWGRDVTMLLAWVVAFQATSAGIYSRRRSLFELAARLLKTDTIQSFKTIQKILESVDDHGVVDVFRKYPAPTLISAIYALSRLQAASELHNETSYGASGTYHPMKDFPLLDDDELLEELCHYAPFASAAYGWWLDLATSGRFHRGDLHAVLRMTKLDPKDVVKVDWESRANRPAFFIARDRRRKRIVLSIRGTWSAHDILTDLCCTSEEYFVCSRRHRAHNGMLAAARAVKALAEEIIEKELHDYPDFTPLLVGHSLGGSVAAILGQMWSGTFRGVTVYTYGPACVAPMNEMNNRNIVSVMLEGDPFSSLSLGHVADTSRALAYLCEEEDLRIGILTVTDGPLETVENDELSWCNEKMEEVRKQMTGEKLYPPGRLIFLSDLEGRQGPPIIHEVPPCFFDELKISARMFDLSRHVPRVYQRRLQKAVRSQAVDPNR